MTTETIEPVQTVIQKLADLTNRLPDDQAAVISMFVDTAYTEDASDGETTGAPEATDEAPLSEEAMAAAVAELYALRESMPSDEQEIVDGMVQQAAGHEPEVAGHWWQHRFTVTVPGFGTAQSFYRSACNLNQRVANPNYSIGNFQMVFNRFSTTYHCWAWI